MLVPLSEAVEWVTNENEKHDSLVIHIHHWDKSEEITCVTMLSFEKGKTVPDNANELFKYTANDLEVEIVERYIRALYARLKRHFPNVEIHIQVK